MSDKEIFYLRPDSEDINRKIWNNCYLAARTMYKDFNGCMITISPINNSRTLQQNRYYWKLCGLLADKTGYEKEDISEYALIECGFTRESKTWKGVEQKAVSTTTLKVNDFTRLIDYVVDLCVDNEIAYPQPEYYGMGKVA
jgi:hypothetical protein